nr:carbon-nitrogen hydrolase family protein [Streptomyces sp. WMMB 322]
MRAAVGQFAPVPGGTEENLSAVRELIVSAADRGARLLVLPEYSLSGYDRAWVAEGAPGGGSDIHGEVFTDLARTCELHGISVVMGELERSDGLLYSTSVVLSGGAVAAVHRKTTLTEQETAHGLRSGDVAASPVSLPGLPLPVGQMVCFEHGFPEIALDLALAGAGVLAISSLIGTGHEYLRNLRTRARAQDNGAYVLAANAAGRGWCGASMIVNPRGEVVALADRDAQGIVCADLDPSLVEQERGAEPVLRLRRPGLRPGPGAAAQPRQGL